MSVKWTALLWLFFVTPIFAQGFAGLGTSSEGIFATPAPNPAFSFPADHGAHPEFRIEWWYLTATLTGDDGQDYGAQWTLFRSALGPGQKDGWSSPQIWMGNAGLTSAESHVFAERLARDGVGQAGVLTDPFIAWIDDWKMENTAGDGADALSELSVSAGGLDWSYALSLTASGPLVLQGQDGYSIKSETGQASYYYSQPFYQVRGSIDRNGKAVQVSGQAWLDREWSSQPLGVNQSGWDWFSLHLDSGEKVMGFRLRDSVDGEFTSATWISAEGVPTPLPDGALQIKPLRTAMVAGRTVPVEWQMRIPSRDLDIKTTPLNDSSWLATVFPYWEGPIRFSGSHSGRGYLEMTGY